MPTRWIEWARKLQSIAQTGLYYTANAYDAQRYEAVRDIAAEMLAQPADMDVAQLADVLIREVGPGTPKVVVRGAAFRDDRILLVRESADGGWAAPGGWAEVNEPPSRAVEREVWEESGFEVRARRIIYVEDKELRGLRQVPFHVYTIFFLCDIVAGEPKTSLETTEVGFFAEGQPPPFSTTRTTAEAVARAFDFHRNRDLPARFD